MEQLVFLFEAFVGGFLVFLTEELIIDARYSLPTILISYVVGLLLYLAINQRVNKWATWCLVGAITALVAAVLRVGLVYGGYVSLLAGVDCFAMLNLTNLTYLLFALSGCVTGVLIALNKNLNIKHSGIIGISLGVLYHLKIATGWWTAVFPANVFLFLGEFLAPILFVYICYFYARSLAYVVRKGRGSIPD